MAQSWPWDTQIAVEKRPQNEIIGTVLVSLLLTLNIFHTFSVRLLGRNPKTVFSEEITPAAYSMASMIGAGLRDKEITLAFAEMINQKFVFREYDSVKENFNAVSLSCKPTAPINGFGNASTNSANKAKNIYKQ